MEHVKRNKENQRQRGNKPLPCDIKFTGSFIRNGQNKNKGD